MASNGHRSMRYVALSHETDEKATIVFAYVFRIGVYDFGKAPKELTRMHESRLDVGLDAVRTFLPFWELGGYRSHKPNSSVAAPML
jgi:hypothetical protein